MKTFFKFLAIVVIFVSFTLVSFDSYADDFIEDVESMSVSAENQENINFEIFSKCAIVYERNSKQILYDKNIHEKVPMASTTKIMTCILILENCDLESIISVSQTAASTIGSRLGLSVNDSISINDLLYGLMLCSGNDAAVCLAEACSGSVDDFAILMNSKATELGLSSTNFVTPHGLDNDNHFTTAYDFAILTDYAIQNPLFKQIVGTKYCNVSINGTTKQIHNTNELLGSISGVYGVKTGYTSKAGRCLVSAVARNNLDIIVIVFGADTKNIRNSDSIKLINYVFSNYEAFDIKTLILDKYSEYQSYYLPYCSINKSFDSLETHLQDFDIEFFPVKKSDSRISFASLTTFDLDSPVEPGHVVGIIDVWVDNSKIYSVNIYSSAYIKRKDAIDYILFFFLQYKNFYTL
ncbi:MAG: D-alanyl-D-alanine carboxypeptidase [Clostridia bacterium]|nr:D-alanyl-D-alanine carboxypeptidase [Clostridia bacterium]